MVHKQKGFETDILFLTVNLRITYQVDIAKIFIKECFQSIHGKVEIVLLEALITYSFRVA